MRRALFPRSTAFVLTVLALAGIAAACDGGNTITPNQTRYVEGVAGTWQRINPLFASTNEVDSDLSRLVFSGLTRVDGDGSPAPDLAESWEIVNNDRTYVMHLREDVEWHDGEEFTSRDVAFTVEQLRNPDFQGDPLLAAGWDAVEVATPDEHTVEFTLPAPYAPFLSRQATLGILPAHLLESLSALDLYNAPFNSRPIGTGPYRLATLTQEAALFEADIAYHGGSPRIATLEVRFYPDYPAAVRAVEAGDVDGLMLREAGGSSLVDELASVGGTETETPNRSAYFVFYLNNDRVPFNEPSIRRAVSLALDREALVAGPLGGRATASSSPITPGTWAYNSEHDATTPDLEEARALLDAAGWEVGDAGIRLRAGQEFRFTIRTDDDPARMALASAIADQLAEVGISAEVASTTYGVLLRDFLRQRQYDAAVVLWNQGPDPDMYAWHSAELGPDGKNIANVEDFVLDSLIESARQASDAEIRSDYYDQLQDVWQERVPSAIIAYPRYTYVQDSSVSRDEFGVLATAAERFATIFRWDTG